MKNLTIEEQAILLQNALGCGGINTNQVTAEVIIKTYNLLLEKGDQFSIKDANTIKLEVKNKYEAKEDDKSLDNEELTHIAIVRDLFKVESFSQKTEDIREYVVSQKSSVNPIRIVYNFNTKDLEIIDTDGNKDVILFCGKILTVGELRVLKQQLGI